MQMDAEMNQKKNKWKYKYLRNEKWSAQKPSITTTRQNENKPIVNVVSNASNANRNRFFDGASMQRKSVFVEMNETLRNTTLLLWIVCKHMLIKSSSSVRSFNALNCHSASTETIKITFNWTEHCDQRMSFANGILSKTCIKIIQAWHVSPAKILNEHTDYTKAKMKIKLFELPHGSTCF